MEDTEVAESADEHDHINSECDLDSDAELDDQRSVNAVAGVDGIPRTAEDWLKARFDPLFPGAKVSVLQQAYFILNEKCVSVQRDNHFDRHCK
mgnify:CR=1 FL=1